MERKLDLYNKCELCDGSGNLPEELVSLGACICNGSGFTASGLTTSQVNMFIARNNTLQEELTAATRRLQQIEDVCIAQRAVAEELIRVNPHSVEDEQYRIGVMAVTTRIADLYVRG